MRTSPLFRPQKMIDDTIAHRQLLALVTTVASCGGLAISSVVAGELPAPQSTVQIVESRNDVAKDRAERIKTLANVLVEADRSFLLQKAGVIRDAIRDLVTDDVIDMLVEEIGYPDVSPPGIERPRTRVGSSQLGPMIVRLPAVAALIEIGEPCVGRVIDKLLVTESDTEFKACVVVLQAIGNDAVKHRLDRALKDVPAEIRARMHRALDQQPETIDSYRERMRQYAQDLETFWRSRGTAPVAAPEQ